MCSRQKSKPKTVRGYVIEVPSNSSKQNDSSDEEDGDDEEDNWLDYSQLNNAFSQGTFVKTFNKKPRICRVALKDLDHPGQKHSCRGRFVLLDPWWEMTVHIGAQNQVQGTTLYSVRQDEDGIREQNLVPYLINTALQRSRSKESRKGNESNQIMDKFDEFVRNRNKSNKLTFEDLDPELKQFVEVYPVYRGSITSARYGETIQAVLRGRKYPALLNFLCHLFPLSFLNYLLAAKEDMMAPLQEAAKKTPWVFGFRAIMAGQFQLYGAEANCKAFEMAGLMDSIPPVPKDALYIYEVLKTDARYGHTYISLQDLQQHHHWKHLSHTVSNWLPALTFLTDNHVTYEERFDCKRNIFLYHNWKAEVDITAGLEEVLSRGIKAGEPTWSVDFSSSDLASLRGDSDQWTAAQKVTGSPVCIMSGKGGCGKTTVVTRLIQHACRPNTFDTVFKEVPSNFPSDAQREEQHDILDSTVSPFQEQVTPEQISQMIDSATQSLEDKQVKKRHPSAAEIEKGRIQVNLITDLIKYLGTTGDTALSRTSVGRKILLTAPTGKAAKLLGHKAKMESCTLHRVVFSYRAFIKARLQEKQGKEKGQGMEDGQTDDCSKDRQDKSNRNSEDKTRKSNDEYDNKEEIDLHDSASVAKWKYAGTNVLIVDECSLVPPRIFATVLNILLDNTPLHKVVLLGDVRQLPSIEPGNFLSDVFTAFSQRGLGVELRTNHRSESELIVSNATRISHRQLPFVDPVRHFHFCPVEDSEDCTGPERDAVVRELLSLQSELCSHETSQFVAFRRADCDAINELCCKHYNNHTTRKQSGSKTSYDFRIGDKICFRKNGQIRCRGSWLPTYLQDFPDVQKALGIGQSAAAKKSKKKEGGMDFTTAAEQISNITEGDGQQQQAIQGSRDGAVGLTDYHRHQTPTASSASVKPQQHLRLRDTGLAEADDGHPGLPQQVSESILQVSASEDTEEEEEKADKLKDGEVQLCNGEVFFIMDDVSICDRGKEHRYLVLSDRDPECPRVVCAPYLALRRECRIRHSWARTIHTYQGSESDTVVYYVGNSALQNWKHVYTAVTRGRKAVFIVGRENDLRCAVKEREKTRRARLARRLTNMMKDVDFKNLHAVIRKINEQAAAAICTPAPKPQGSPERPTKAHNIAGAPSGASPSLGSLIDSFFDSDDSWVKDMSPAWTEEHSANKGVHPGAATPSFDFSGNSFLQSRKPSQTAEEEEMEDIDVDKSTTPCKRQLSSEQSTTPTKRSHPDDSADSVISPVRRVLHI